MRPFQATLPALALLVLVDCASPAPPEDDSVWFTPNLGSLDLVDLFSRPDGWARARSSTRVFKFYEENLISAAPADCPLCGPNLLPDLVSRGAFVALSSWGLRIAIEVPVVKSWSCDTLLARSRAQEALHNVEASGAAVRFLAMDEPLLGGEGCGLDPGASAARVQGFIADAQVGRPSLAVGDIEPYPRFSVSDIEAWTTALEASGTRPAFFHLDVDRVEADRRKANLAADLQSFEAFFQGRGIPFGVILWGQGASDRAYYDDVRAWVATVSRDLGRPRQLVFQSWAAGEKGQRTIPDNLPESDPTVYSHTRLVNDGLAAFPP